jgi:hypothetical protein
VEIVARKEADIAVSYLSGDVQRAKKVLFSQPYVKQNRRVFFNRASFARLQRDHSIASSGQLADTAVAPTLEFGVLANTINDCWVVPVQNRAFSICHVHDLQFSPGVYLAQWRDLEKAAFADTAGCLRRLGQSDRDV